MDKYFISDFKKIYQDIILRNQKTLNPDGNEYIDGDEIGKVEAYFKRYGFKSISELLANQDKEDDETVGTDTVEISDSSKEVPEETETKPKAKVGNDTPETTEGQTDETVTDEESFLKKIKMGFNHEGSGAEEIMQTIMSDIKLSSSGTPFSGAYNSICAKKKEAIANGQDTSDYENQIKDMEDIIKDYIRDNYEQVQKNLNTITEKTTFKYGKDKSKTGSYTQTLSVKGNGGVRGNNENDSSSDTEGTDDENTDNEDKSKNNSFGVIYGLNLETENTNVQFMTDVSSDNIDLALAAETKKQLSKGVISASGALRETIESGYSEGSGGVAVEYTNNKNNFFTGVYGLYNYDKAGDEDANFGTKLAAYGRYKDTLRLELSREQERKLKSYIVNLNAKGRKEIPDKNISLSGQIGSEYTLYNFDLDLPDMKIPYIHHAEIKGRGHLIFRPDSDTQVSFGGSAKYGVTFCPSLKNDEPIHEYSFGALGNFTNKHVGVTAMLSGINTLGVNSEGKLDNVTRLSSNVTIDLHNLFKGITPYISYTLNTGAAGPDHNIGGGVRLSVDALTGGKDDK